MVVFVDLDQDAFRHPGSLLAPEKLRAATSKAAEFPPSTTSTSTSELKAQVTLQDAHTATTLSKQSPTSKTPNCNAFSAALSCYPIVKEIARAVDLNTLHALSRTCRQFHVNLAPFRHQLVRETLRCENEYIETVSDMLDGRAVLPDSVKSVLRLLSQGNGDPGRMTRGKVGRCARDMVGDCRRCTKIVCRNCTIKPPSQTALKGRIRRLCQTCGTAPLSHHLYNTPPNPTATEHHEETSIPNTLASNVCNCDDVVWLCIQCGQTLRSNDITYRRVWAWRTRYSTYLGGGLGTGIGEGSQGVKCGRGETCLAAKEIELEVDCEVDESSSDTSSTGHSSPAHSSYHTELLSTDSHDGEEPGYFRQEVIGLGGVVKHKAKKRVMVGSCVVEYEDERETGTYLVREEGGSHRAWCGWCSRVIPAKSETFRS
ncbi:hypothetical protein N7509_006844 [Penicillium cosmopolitanum]|uniref:Uncharacterized protein n=1 Tax=Penicillium cosmopolitanum TaxID=1131564 RepID=A0A9X0B7U0_9EURO|nr:uncharacterized protein N7509_006844 [Penicillium cosmopolitanum]KAJ5391354.1 hypothetical protein N7509_006844 [Penicillium cosmopolitanum]